jgi:hypothetical protein
MSRAERQKLHVCKQLIHHTLNPAHASECSGPTLQDWFGSECQARLGRLQQSSLLHVVSTLVIQWNSELISHWMSHPLQHVSCLALMQNLQSFNATDA